MPVVLIIRGLAVAVTLVSLVSLTAGVPAPEIGSFPKRTDTWVWEDVPRVVAMGDVHGSHNKLVSMLISTGMIDSSLAWAGGADHLVLCGDMIDRGRDDRAVLDLVRRLQQEADAAGGRVHSLLGNHEVMNLIRDLRYVDHESYADFAAEEQARDRRDAWNKFRRAPAWRGAKSSDLEEAFNERYPAGYFAREQAFRRDGEYGGWLLQQPAVIKVNGVVFLHGGLTEQVAALGLEEINRQVLESVRKIVETSETIEGFVSGPADFADLHGAARRLAGDSGRRTSGRAISAGKSFLRNIEKLPFQPEGPLWYRGNSLENERAERYRVDEVLQLLDARAIMVGHTPTKTGRISSRFDGQLYRGDVGMGYGRNALALVLEGDDVQVYDPVARNLSPPPAEAPQGEGWTGAQEDLPDDELEDFLADARVVSSREVTRGDQRGWIVELKGEGLSLRAVFKDVDEPAAVPASAGTRYQHEMAAYWLDRRLELCLVPVSIARSIEGRRGTIRAISESAIDLVSIRSSWSEEEIEAARQELAADINKARVFDALIGNPDRQDFDALLIPDERRIVLVDHEAAFSTSPELTFGEIGRPEEGSAPCDPIGEYMEQNLRSIDTDELRSSVGDYLSEAQIDALLARRDALLQLCGDAG